MVYWIYRVSFSDSINSYINANNSCLIPTLFSITDTAHWMDCSFIGRYITNIQPECLWSAKECKRLSHLLKFILHSIKIPPEFSITPRNHEQTFNAWHHIFLQQQKAVEWYDQCWFDVQQYDYCLVVPVFFPRTRWFWPSVLPAAFFSNVEVVNVF